MKRSPLLPAQCQLLSQLWGPLARMAGRDVLSQTRVSKARQTVLHERMNRTEMLALFFKMLKEETLVFCRVCTRRQIRI